MIWLLDRTVEWLVIAANWFCYFAARLEGVDRRSRVVLQVARSYQQKELIRNQTGSISSYD